MSAINIIEIDSMSERILQASIKELAKELDVKAIRRGLRKGAEIIRDAAKEKAPQLKSGRLYHEFTLKSGEKMRFKRGNLKRSIKILRKWKKDPKGVYVGPQIKKRKVAGVYADDSNVHGWYAHFVEYGSGFINKIGPRPFMRSAFEANKIGALMANEDGLWKEYKKKIKKLKKGVPVR